MIKYNSVTAAIDALISCAEAEVGYLEKASNKDLYSKTGNAGKNNHTKYGKEMHDIYPTVMDYPAYWCDAYVDWCFYKTFGTSNAKKVLGGNFNDYTVASAQLYKNKSAWYTSPKRGDQVFFKNSVRINHTGIVYKVDTRYVYTIEGNTSDGSAVVANGGMVCKKKYLLTNTNIAGYGRPLYSLAVQEGTPLVTYDIRTGKSGLIISVDSTLNVRSYPKTGQVISSLKNGEYIFPTKKTFLSNGEPWYYLPDKKGWISAKYIDRGWVYEASVASPYKWWFIHKGYTCTTNGIEMIGKKFHVFNEDGYMIEGTEVLFNTDENGIMKFKKVIS